MTPEQEALASIDVSLRRIATALEAKEKRELNAIADMQKHLAKLLAINSTWGKLGSKPETTNEVPYPDAYADAVRGTAYFDFRNKPISEAKSPIMEWAMKSWWRRWL